MLGPVIFKPPKSFVVGLGIGFKRGSCGADSFVVHGGCRVEAGKFRGPDVQRFWSHLPWRLTGLHIVHWLAQLLPLQMTGLRFTLRSLSPIIVEYDLYTLP